MYHRLAPLFISLSLCTILLSACFGRTVTPKGVLVLKAGSEIPAASDRTDLLGKNTPAAGRINLIVDGADLKTAINTVAQLGGINISIDKDVWGDNIRARFLNVPWDLAMASLLQSHNLALKKVGSVYRVGPRDKLSLERDNNSMEGVGKENIKTNFIKLKKTPAAEVAPVVKELLLSPWGVVIPYPPANLLIIRDDDRVVTRIKDFVQKLEENQSDAKNGADDGLISLDSFDVP